MPEASHHNFLLMLQLRTLNTAQREHSRAIGHLDGRLMSIERYLHHLLLRTNGGRPSCPQATSQQAQAQPTPGAQPSPPPTVDPSSGWKDRLRAIGEIGQMASLLVGLIKGAIWLAGIIIPSLLLAVTAVWKLTAPYWSRLLGGF